MTREEFEDELRRDSYEESRLEHELRNDYEKFRSYFDEDFVNLNVAIHRLRNLFDMYEYEFDVREVDELL